QQLLKAHDEATQFLESPAVGTVPTLAAEAIPVRQRDSIGPYKIREKIAEGGMGAVYVAEQTEPVRRKVALKVIRPGLAGPNVVARFEAERQALAMMNHPNIARVLDGGATDDQLPYFVMELVQGLPITEYCDQKRLTTDQRLKLFVDVCHAVQHAHQKGIIHRDLKPSNVMVAEIDGKAVPKVIDFGVAKALHQRLTDQTVYTQFSQMVGTPLYMSPEQAGLGVIDVDTRSDVYSLGVVLYELLTGDTPYDRETLKRVTFDEMRRIIREEEPRRPSAMVSTLAAQQRSTVSERRGIDPRKLGDSLRGELDWLVMKALEKDRDRRYESASALAADIERYLDNEPVEACPPSVSYRLKKFGAKHKGLLTTAALLAAMLLLSTFVSANFAVQANQERGKAVAAQEQSEENFTAALDAIDKLLEHASSPELAEVPQVQPIRKKILEDVLAFYEGFRANTGDSPQIRFRAGQTWRSLGSLAKEIEEKELAEKSFLQAIAFAESLTSEVPGNRDYQLLHLGSLGSLGSFCLYNLKDTERAERVYQQELQVMDQFFQAEPQNRDFWSRQKIFAYRHLADVARSQADYDKAVEYVSKAEALAEELNDTDLWSEYGRQSSLAVNYELSNPELADKSYRRSVELGRKLMKQSITRTKRHIYGS
ncbi:MAG: serine/threonine-protein kinase, partial [Planctomycetes bacterium]|nr:serine/threonine-protein kinase [Planctomycetota bacterium]